MALKIGKDHWAFLDEIEAPMWVDLILEAKSDSKYIDDGWFHTSHLFHQQPSFELKVAFSHSDIDSKGSSSPKLPSSVSRSRGKHYGSKKQKEGQHILLLDKQHPVKVLSQKSLWVNSGSGEEIIPKVSFINSKGNSRSQRSFFVQRNLTGNAKNSDSKAPSSHGDSQCSSSCMEDRSDSNASIITSESDQKPQQKNPEVPSQTFGYSSGLLSAMRNSLRKSCVTRQASRVDVSNRRQSRDCSSVSGKSSVGSSSNPGWDCKNSTFALKQQREQTPDSRGEATLIRATKTQEKGYTISKASIQVKDGTCNSSRRRNNISKPAQHDATKSKVQNQTLHAKASIRYRVDERRLLTGAPKTKEKVTVCGRNKFVGAGNKNMTGRVPVDQKCHGGDVTTGVMARGQKGTKQDDRTRYVGFKPGKLSSPSRGKHPTRSATQRVYLR